MDESYDIPRSHQLPYTKIHDSNSINISSGGGGGGSSNMINNNSNMESSVSGTSMSMLELSEDRSSMDKACNWSEAEFSSSTMPKRRHFYTNAAPAKFEGTFFRYDFEDKVSSF